MRAVVAAGLLLTAAPAIAGDAAPADADIVVTARRRTERLQDVPVAVTALQAEKLDLAGVFNLNRSVQLLPSVNFYASNPRNAAIIIRGPQGTLHGKNTTAGSVTFGVTLGKRF